jgi:phosphonate transport system substrate-binding protein
MFKKAVFTLTLLLLVAAVVLVACAQPQSQGRGDDGLAGGQPTTIATDPPLTRPAGMLAFPTRAPEETPEPEATEEEAEPELGSEERPIQVLFVPSVEAGMITTGGEVMAQALSEATGLTFEVVVPTSYAATIEAMCAAPGDTMGFIPALGYVIANNRCGVEVAAAAVRRGLSWYATMYLVPADSTAASLADLEGAPWAFPDQGSTSGFLYPSSEFAAAGVTPGEQISAGGHPQAVLAVYNNEAGVGTAFFSPPIKPDDPDYRWEYGTSPEPWLEEGLDPAECFVDAEGALMCGEYRVLDARLTVVETAPDVMAKTRILALSAKIPNDTLSFGPEFPAELSAQIIDALIAFSQTDAWLESIGNEEFYGWSSLEPVDDTAYDPVRNLITQLGYTEEDILGG